MILQLGRLKDIYSTEGIAGSKTMVAECFGWRRL